MAGALLKRLLKPTSNHMLSQKKLIIRTFIPLVRENIETATAFCGLQETFRMLGNKEIKKVISVKCRSCQERSDVSFSTQRFAMQLYQKTAKLFNHLGYSNMHQLQTNASILHHSLQRSYTKRVSSKINQARHLVSSPAGELKTGFRT